jgi:diguanylate cyclase (GGDEF)-like protein
LPLCAINAVNAVLLILSQFNGWYYYIDSDNIYHRGPLFFFPVITIFMLIIAAFTIIVKNRGNMEKKSFFSSLTFFAIPPLIGIILQVKFYGTSFVLNSVVLSMLVVFINIQNHSMYTDHLTGVNNRKKLDAYLKKKVKLCAREKSFSAILIDINNFKYINDTYGHDAGDNALEISAKLLKSCISTSDFIARFGGDEFCIVLDITNDTDLEALVGKINNCLERYNKSGIHLYELEFSMGYAVYDCRLYKSAAEFLKHIDILMYENKHASKNKQPVVL